MIASKCIVSLQHMVSTGNTSVTSVSLPPEQKQFICRNLFRIESYSSHPSMQFLYGTKKLIYWKKTLSKTLKCYFLSFVVIAGWEWWVAACSAPVLAPGGREFVSAQDTADSGAAADITPPRLRYISTIYRSGTWWCFDSGPRYNLVISPAAVAVLYRS